VRLGVILAVVAVAGFAAAGIGLGAGGGVVKLTAKLNSHHETPAPKGASRGSGLFAASLSGRSLTWRLTFSRLTGKAVAAHVHLGKPGVAGPVAVPLCGPCVPGAHGKVTVTAKVRSALVIGGAYVNIHTAKNPGGEIRGQVTGGGQSPGPTPTGTTTTTPTTTTPTTTTTTTDGYGY
jgi:CHRD domain-containing protein